MYTSSSCGRCSAHCNSSMQLHTETAGVVPLPETCSQCRMVDRHSVKQDHHVHLKAMTAAKGARADLEIPGQMFIKLKNGGHIPTSAFGYKTLVEWHSRNQHITLDLCLSSVISRFAEEVLRPDHPWQHLPPTCKQSQARQQCSNDFCM